MKKLSILIVAMMVSSFIFEPQKDAGKHREGRGEEMTRDDMKRKQHPKRGEGTICRSLVSWLARPPASQLITN